MKTTEMHETSGSTSALILKYVRKQGGEAAVCDVLRLADLPYSLDVLESTTSWITYAARVRLLEAATEVLGDEDTAYRAGLMAFTDGLDHANALLMRFFTSPKGLYRRMPSGIRRYTGAATMTLVGLTSTTAVFHFKNLPGFKPSRLACELTQGFLAGAPVAFGLAKASMVHDECEADGHDACTYRLSWERSPRAWGRGRARLSRDLELTALRGQLADLQDAASDLVASKDVATVRQRVVDHATTVVSAGYVLLVDSPHQPEPLVTSFGLEAHEVAEIVAGAVSGTLSEAERRIAVFEVASSRHRYGSLIAIRPEGIRLDAADHTLISAYVKHAAAALDLLSAVESSLADAHRATALLDLAKGLAGARNDDTVANVVAQTLPNIAGGGGASVLLWDARTGILHAAASGGPGGHAADDMRPTFRHEELSFDIPEVAEVLTHHAPITVDAATASPALAPLLADVGIGWCMIVPIVAGDDLLGALALSWGAPLVGPALSETMARVSGVADQAATALQNARLLTTVQHQSLHDALTGLPNRVLFSRELEGALRHATEATTTAVLFCDLDKFKQVNDRFGHAAGDELLRQVAGRLRNQLRVGDTVARLSGDEFAVLLAGSRDDSRAIEVAHRLVEALDQPFRVDGHDIRITSSIGVATHVGPDGRADRLLGTSDSAMYEAKKRGRNQVAVCGDVSTASATQSLEGELALAIANGELRLHFQPVVDVSSPGESVVVGAEALLRWQHPRLGLLLPGSFLPIAEESGLITDLDLWALDAACDALAGWHLPADASAGTPPLRVAVNLAAGTLVDPRLVPAVRAAILRNSLGSQQLDLEVVESRALVDVPGVVDRLAELRHMGVRISLDDFGTGFSTLAWLHDLPIDQIKIDRSFVAALSVGSSVALVRGVLAMAEELGIEVVAEGVEETDQIDLLRSIGCEMAQGYLLGRPGAGFVGSALPFEPRRTDAHPDVLIT